MAIFFFLFGATGIIVGAMLAIELSAKEATKIASLFTLSAALVILPFIGNTSHIEKHVVLRTDSFQDVTYNKVVMIEYDVPKADHWWTWKVLSLGEMENVEVFFEE